MNKGRQRADHRDANLLYAVTLLPMNLCFFSTKVTDAENVEDNVTESVFPIPATSATITTTTSLMIYNILLYWHTVNPNVIVSHDSCSLRLRSFSITEQEKTHRTHSDSDACHLYHLLHVKFAWALPLWQQFPVMKRKRNTLALAKLSGTANKADLRKWTQPAFL